MTTILEEMQFELLPWAEAESGVAFGIGLPVSVDGEGFTPGGVEWYTEDSEVPHNGATQFGQDHMSSTPWGWAAHLNRYDVRSALAALGELETMWRAPEIRQVDGAVTALRYQIAGRTRRIYGRPRRFDKTPNNLLLSGYAPISMDFKPSDVYTYDDEESFLDLRLASNDTGGLILPAVPPFRTISSGRATQQAVVGGDAPTSPVIRFNGPLVDPTLETSDWELPIKLTIPDGQFLEIDTRPWAYTVMLNGDTSVPGALGPRTYLSKILFQPNTRHDLKFRAHGGSTQGGVSVRWRSAHNSL